MAMDALGQGVYSVEVKTSLTANYLSCTMADKTK